jgi:catechol-2,3-dioxygenase
MSASQTYTATFQNSIRVRTLYFKVEDALKVANWWSQFLGIKLHKENEYYSEIKVNDFRLAFLKNDFGDKFDGNRSTIMFECETWGKLLTFVENAKKSGAKLIEDSLQNEDLRSCIFEDPFGNEFEIGNLNHD